MISVSTSHITLFKFNKHINKVKADHLNDDGFVSAALKLLPLPIIIVDERHSIRISDECLYRRIVHNKKVIAQLNAGVLQHKDDRPMQRRLEETVLLIYHIGYNSDDEEVEEYLHTMVH